MQGCGRQFKIFEQFHRLFWLANEKLESLLLENKAESNLSFQIPGFY